jgi:hypothetical protein
MRALSLEMHLSNGRIVRGNGLTGMIEVALAQLESYRATTSKPDQLDWEIRLYQFILSQSDPESAARAYLTARASGKSGQKPKRLVVQELGWKIP